MTTRVLVFVGVALVFVPGAPAAHKELGVFDFAQPDSPEVMTNHTNNNGIVINATFNPMNESGGYVINGTGANIFLYDLSGLIVGNISLKNPVDAPVQSTKPDSENHTAFFWDIGLSDGTWKVIDETLLSTITSFRVRLWDGHKHEDNSTVTLFSDMANFTRDLKSTYNVTVEASRTIGQIVINGGQKSATCTSNSFTSPDLPSVGLLDVWVTGWDENMGLADSTARVLYVKHLYDPQSLILPRGAMVLPGVGNGGRNMLATSVVQEGQNYAGIFQGFLLPPPGYCYGQANFGVV